MDLNKQKAFMKRIRYYCNAASRYGIQSHNALLCNVEDWKGLADQRYRSYLYTVPVFLLLHCSLPFFGMYYSMSVTCETLSLCTDNLCLLNLMLYDMPVCLHVTANVTMAFLICLIYPNLLAGAR